MEVPTQLHYCRWDWCNATFTSAEQHKEHIEEHIKRATPIRRSDVKLVQRAEETLIHNSMNRTGDSSARPSSDVAVITESSSLQQQQPPLPPPSATAPTQMVPPVPPLPSEWYTLSNIGPLATSTQPQADPAQQWQPQSQLPFDLDHSITSIDSNHQ